MWKFKKEFEDIKITLPGRVVVDQFTITDALVDQLLKTSGEHAIYFERDKNDDPAPAGLKTKRQRDEGKE
jgi:hypothetical protein